VYTPTDDTIRKRKQNGFQPALKANSEEMMTEGTDAEDVVIEYKAKNKV